MNGIVVNRLQPFEKSIELAGKQARYYDLFERINVDSTHSKPVVHFYGGNGFPVGVYEPLLTELSQQFDVISLAMQGYWFDLPESQVLTREQDADHLIEFLEKTQDKPVIGVGHSQGATATAMAAAKRPDLFSALYLIDPVTFTKKQSLVFNRIPRLFLLTKEPFKSTRVKPADWDSVEAYYDNLRQNRAFKRISDPNLKIFAQNSLVAKQNSVEGYSLLFTPKQELASYFATPYITPALKKLNKKKVPYYLILAKPSIFNSEKVRQSWKGVVPIQNRIVLSDYGHLLPIEAPKACAEVIFNFEQSRIK
ncbi:alpha/beta hydrolase [Psychrobacter sp.]|uniref:alpha/beta hydrolase n=1 Tax=Psychrobacter sp. TaxID=56811 RepID=UPI0025D3718D|nr:alpha/beta hydrolase [Psychrobacter sp.]